MTTQRPSRGSGSRILPRAKEFLDRTARILERRRFAYLFDGGDARSVVLALQAYQNEDGGYGHALEPDLRGPESEPIPAWTALGVLDEVEALHGPAISGVLQWLASAEVPGGGIPFVFPAATRSPHAPWWESGPGTPRGSLNPTAGVVAYLWKNRVGSDWVERAADWCWKKLERWRVVTPYELRVVLAFLDHSPDPAKAERVLARLEPAVRSPRVIELDPAKHRSDFRPLDVSPGPGLPSRGLFTEEEIQGNLDLIVRSQRRDGGWGVGFPIWTPATRCEWEGCQTLEMLKILRDHDRLPRASAGPRTRASASATRSRAA